MPEPAGHAPRPLAAIAGFAAHLRDQGFQVGIPEQQAMVRTTLAVDLADQKQLEGCWRSLVCGNADQWRRYPELFRAYWFPKTGRTLPGGGQIRPKRDLRQIVADLHAAADAGASAVAGAGGEGDSDTTADDRHAQGGASRTDARAQRDLRDWGQEDMARLERIVEAMAERMRRRLTRRRRLDALGHALDLRKTLRRSLRTGGVPFEPAWLKRRRERPRLFVLVDVSRSMELYARLFLRLARAFALVLDARVFVFHTHLAEVTAQLRKPGERARAKLEMATAGFAGGTRIAGCLADFLGSHARRALSRGARVIILSDGFDSDGDAALARQLAAIRARGAAIYWLHPTREPPQASALAGCSDAIAAFAPVHDLASLSRLEHLLD